MKTDRLRKSSFFSMLLALLGVGASSCIFLTPCMYGSPSADWSVKGRVLDENGKRVPGLQVILGSRYENSENVIYDQNYFPLDTLYTGMDGSYHMEGHGFPLNQLQVDIHDVDGPSEGGEFTDVTLIIKDFEFEGGKGWYSGHAEINIPDIIVKKK